MHPSGNYSLVGMTANDPHWACLKTLFLCVLVCTTDYSGPCHISGGLLYGCCSLTQPTPTHDLIHMCADAFSSLVCPQSWLSGPPVGAAVQQRSAHSFSTRSTPSSESCAFQGILLPGLIGLVPCPGSRCCGKTEPVSTYPDYCMCQWMQWSVLAWPAQPRLPPVLVLMLPSGSGDSACACVCVCVCGGTDSSLGSCMFLWCCSPIWHGPSCLNIHWLMM